MQRSYITVAEYAAVRGISKQAVYKMMKTGLNGGLTGLNNHIQLVNHDGKMQKVLDIAVLSPDELTRWEALLIQPIQPQVVQPVPEVVQPHSTSEPVAAPAFDAAQRAFDLLENQLKEKDRLIESLRAAIQEKDRHIQEQSVALTNLLATSQELQRNNQILLRLASGDPQEGQQETGSSAAAEADTSAPETGEPAQKEPQRERRGFWAWLLGG